MTSFSSITSVRFPRLSYPYPLW